METVETDCFLLYVPRWARGRSRRNEFGAPAKAGAQGYRRYVRDPGFLLSQEHGYDPGGDKYACVCLTSKPGRSSPASPNIAPSPAQQRRSACPRRRAVEQRLAEMRLQ